MTEYVLTLLILNTVPCGRCVQIIKCILSFVKDPCVSIHGFRAAPPCLQSQCQDFCLPAVVAEHLNCLRTTCSEMVWLN